MMSQRRRMMAQSHIFQFTYTGTYDDKRVDGVGSIDFLTSGTLSVLSRGKANLFLRGGGGGGGGGADYESGIYGGGGGGGGGSGYAVTYLDSTIAVGTYVMTIGTGGAGGGYGGGATGGSTNALGKAVSGGAGGQPGSGTSGGHGGAGMSSGERGDSGATLYGDAWGGFGGDGGTPNGGNGGRGGSYDADEIIDPDHTLQPGWSSSGYSGSTGTSGVVTLTFS